MPYVAGQADQLGDCSGQPIRRQDCLGDQGRACRRRGVGGKERPSQGRRALQVCRPAAGISVSTSAYAPKRRRKGSRPVTCPPRGREGRSGARCPGTWRPRLQGRPRGRCAVCESIHISGRAEVVADINRRPRHYGDHGEGSVCVAGAGRVDVQRGARHGAAHSASTPARAEPRAGQIQAQYCVAEERGAAPAACWRWGGGSCRHSGIYCSCCGCAAHVRHRAWSLGSSMRQPRRLRSQASLRLLTRSG